MPNTLHLEKLSEANFAHFENLTRDEGGGGCYCAFWHQKWTSMEQWKGQCQTQPLRNRDAVLAKVRAGFHVGTLAYEGDAPIAWISVGPLPDVFWTWRRVAKLGEESRSIAGIHCITVEPTRRRQGLQATLLRELANYGRDQKWTLLEGYPFDMAAIEKHGPEFLWPGHPNAFSTAGFDRIDAHWLATPDHPRSIYRLPV